MRTGKIPEGEIEFRKLIEEFSGAKFIVSSYIDGLLFIRLYDKALEVLQEHQIKMTDGAWYAGQYGRAYFGLNDYPNAIEASKQQLRFDASPIVYQNLARAYHGIGNTNEEINTLEKGLHLHPDSKRLIIQMAALLERIGSAEEGKTMLLPLYEEDKYNGWIIFPLIKILAKFGELDEAVKIVAIADDKIQPEHLRSSIVAEIASKQGRFNDAIQILQRKDDDEHAIGQRLEAYFSWAAGTIDPMERQSIAEMGLQNTLPRTIDNTIKNNVPLLISIGKLAVLANNCDLFKSIRSKVHAINPNVQEIERTMLAMKPEWASP